MTYNEAVMSYDGLDDRSLAVDDIQRRVSVGLFLRLKEMIWVILIKTSGLHWSLTTWPNPHKYFTELSFTAFLS